MSGEQASKGKRHIIASVLLIALLIAACWWWSRPSRQRNAMVNDLIRGFRPNISLRGLHPGHEETGGMTPPTQGGRRPADLLLERVLSVPVPAEADIEAITGTNWPVIAYRDEYYSRSFGADAWRRCVENEIKRKNVSLDQRAARLLNWPPALYHFSLARTYPKPFMIRVVGQLEEDGNIVRKALRRGGFQEDPRQLSAACALYQASIHLDQLSSAPNWKASASRAICGYFEKHQKADGTIDGDANTTLGVVEIVMPAIAVVYRAGKKIEPDLSGRVQSLMEFPMYYLDMYGCLPFLGDNTYYSSNKREWLFWAARAFDRKDFAWVAYGGLDMPGAHPPAQMSRAFPDAGIYVMRNNWEIRRVIRRKPLFDWQHRYQSIWLQQFGYMSHTLHFDARRGALSLFAFGKPQVSIQLPGTNAYVSGGRELSDGIVCEGALGQKRFQIVQLSDLNAWVLRIENLGDKDAVQVSPLCTTLGWTKAHDGLVTDPGNEPMIFEILNQLRFKAYGSVCVRTDGSADERESGNFEIAGKRGIVTVVFLAATETLLDNPNDYKSVSILPVDAAEARQVSFTEAGCVFEKDVGQLRAMPLAKGETNANFSLLKFGEGVSLPTNGSLCAPFAP